jgi:hypothetical protein
MAKGKVPSTKIPTIGGSPQDHQAARAIVEHLQPLFGALNEQMAALDVIQDEMGKRVEKLEKRNNIIVTHKLGYDELIVLKTITGTLPQGDTNEHESTSKKTT